MSNNTKVQNTSLAWLDDSPTMSQDMTVAAEQLRSINSNFQFLKSKRDWDDYLQSQTADATITLIINGKLAKQIVGEIHELTKISSIYIYCMDKATHEEWSRSYAKVCV